MVEFVKYTSILGNITIAIEADTLIGLWFDGQKYDRADMQENFLLLFLRWLEKQ